MKTLKNLAFYNPGILNDEDFIASFVARKEQAGRLLARLKEITIGGLASHYLILGQRGMGKTSLLRWLALGVKNDKDLVRRFIPLSFREEQYNVNSLHVLWLNCLDALGDWYEKNGFQDKAAVLDRQIAQLVKDDSIKDRDGQAALELFLSSCKAEGKRPLLLLDNLDLILNGIGKEQDWSFRRELQKPGGIVIVGASVAYLEATTDAKAAFYDFFQIILLEPLSRTELLSCLEYLARLRGEAGKNVIKVLTQDSARIHTLYDLTGGNPRTLALLCVLLELDTADDVMGNLEHLLDQVTVLYKARVEDQAPQTRVVLDALALNWNPATASDLAKDTGLETSAVSAQLDRLQKNGIIEKVSISTTVRTAYQVSERFFNIWYLMRHAPRRTRNRLRWLTEFLRLFYAPPQLEAHARSLLNGQQRNGEYLLALSDAITDTGLRDELCNQGCKELGLKEEEWKTPMVKELSEQKYTDVPDRLDTAFDLYKQGHYAKAVDQFLKENELNQKDAFSWNWFGFSLERLERYEEAETAYRKAIELNPKDAFGWNNLGCLLENFNRCAEAETAYRKAIELDPQYAYSWNNLGSLLKNLNRYAEAEAAYRKAIELNPQYAYSWNNLGRLLENLNRQSEAEVAYRKAIELNPKDAFGWNNLGCLLEILNRYIEAETAYRKATQLDLKDDYSWDIYSWNNLARLLGKLGRYAEAETACRKAIELNPKYAYSWSILGSLMKNLNRYTEAEAAYRKAIEFDPKDAYSWNDLGNLLQNCLGRHIESEPAYRKALELNPEMIYSAVNLAYLLFKQQRNEDAEQYYQKSVEKLPPHGAALLETYRSIAFDNFGEAVKALGQALDNNSPEVFSNFEDDLLRVLEFFKAKGYGERLLKWMEDGGYQDRFWPVYAAFDAYLHGEVRLKDVNPEVRTAAKRIYDKLKIIRAPQS